MTVLLIVTVASLLAWPSRPPTVWRPLRSPGPPQPAPAAADGGSVARRWLPIGLAAALTVTVSPALGLAVVAGLQLRPRWAARRARVKDRGAVVDALPEAADLLALAVAGGLTVPAALATARRWTPDPVGSALGRATDEIELGRPTADALEDVAVRLGAPARSLVAVLVASERYGVPLGQSLERVAREARLERRRRAEERGRRVPVLLLFPLVLCVLPAFGLLTVVPLLVGSLPDLPP